MYGVRLNILHVCPRMSKVREPYKCVLDAYEHEALQNRIDSIREGLESSIRDDEGQ